LQQIQVKGNIVASDLITVELPHHKEKLSTWYFSSQLFSQDRFSAAALFYYASGHALSI
jgi:hypothetical protein